MVTLYHIILVCQEEILIFTWQQLEAGGEGKAMIKSPVKFKMKREF
jgi:hypothetical protein